MGIARYSAFGGYRLFYLYGGADMTEQTIRYIDGFKKTTSVYEIQIEKIAAVLYSQLPWDTAGIFAFAKTLFSMGVRVENIDDKTLSYFRNFERMGFGKEYE